MIEYITLGLAAISAITLVVLVRLLLKKNNASNDSQAISNLENTQKTETEKLILVQSENTKNISTNISNISSVVALNNKQLEDRLRDLTVSNEKKLENVTLTVREGLYKMQIDNAKQLEEMRKTVDEKLDSTLDKRLNESFSAVSKQLEGVYKGLGEMQKLASSVGDLRSVLSNVKIRGTWGESSLNNLLEQLLTKDQYVEQYKLPPKEKEKVDFAIKLPGKGKNEIYLPIDVKFPIEDYTRLVEASNRFDKEEVLKCSKALLTAIKKQAKSIKEKYIVPPYTTDFAIMYLPIEGLFAEVVRTPGVMEMLQRDYKVIVCGPTTISALLNSLQMGFKTLAIQKRSSEIWSLLNVFKKEFSSFVVLLEKTQKKINEASNTIETATKKTTTIQRKLNKVSLIAEENEEDISENMLSILDTNIDEED